MPLLLSCAAAGMAQGGGTVFDGAGIVAPADEGDIEAAVARAAGRGLKVDVGTRQLVMAGGAGPQLGDSDLLIVIPYDGIDVSDIRVARSPLVSSATESAVVTALANGLYPDDHPGTTLSQRVSAAAVAAVDAASPSPDQTPQTEPTAVQRAEVPLVDAAVESVVESALDSFRIIRNRWYDVRAAFLSPGRAPTAREQNERAAVQRTLRNTIADLRRRPREVGAASNLPVISASSSGWSGARTTWSLLGEEALAAERARLDYYYTGYHVDQVVQELIAVAGRKPDWVDDVQEMFGVNLAKAVAPHHYRLELLSVATIGADWKIPVFGGGGEVQASRHRLFYTNDVVPSAAWQIDVRCLPIALSANASATPAEVAAAIEATAARSFSERIVKAWNTATSLLPSPAVGLMWDLDEDDDYNTAELITDARYTPATFEGFWPLMRVGRSTSVSGFGGAFGSADEYSWLGKGSAMFMNTGGESVLAGGTISRKILQANVPQIARSNYVATGACLGTDVQYLGGAIAKLPQLTTVDPPASSGVVRAMSVILPGGVSAAAQADVVSEVKELASATKSACGECTLRIGFELLTSGPWPPGERVDWQTLATSTVPGHQAVRANYLTTEALATGLEAALGAGTGFVVAEYEPPTPTYQRAGALAELLEAYGEPAAAAGYADWQAAVMLHVTVDPGP